MVCYLKQNKENGLKWTLAINNWYWGNAIDTSDHKLQFSIILGFETTETNNDITNTNTAANTTTNTTTNETQTIVPKLESKNKEKIIHSQGWEMEMPTDFVLFNQSNNKIDKGKLIENGVDISIDTQNTNQIINFKFQKFENNQLLLFDPIQTEDTTNLVSDDSGSTGGSGGSTGGSDGGGSGVAADDSGGGAITIVIVIIAVLVFICCCLQFPEVFNDCFEGCCDIRPIPSEYQIYKSDTNQVPSYELDVEGLSDSQTNGEQPIEVQGEKDSQIDHEEDEDEDEEDEEEEDKYKKDNETQKV